MTPRSSASPRPARRRGLAPTRRGTTFWAAPQDARRALMLAAVVLLMVATAATWLLSTKTRLFTVASPSMGTTAPVGTLVIATPATSYQVGDVITYAHTTSAGVVQHSVTHRIVDIVGNGFLTRGDLNATNDPLPVTASEIIGKASLYPGWGWVLTGLPWLLAGGLLVYLLSFLISSRGWWSLREHGQHSEQSDLQRELTRSRDRAWRWVARISGWSLVVSLVGIWLRPWVNIDLLGFTPAAAASDGSGGGVLMHVVNTGLFRIDAAGTRLVSGQDAVIHVTEQNLHGFYILTPHPALTLWQWVLVILGCLAPLLLALLVAVEDVPDDDEAALEYEAAGVALGRRRRATVLGIVAAVVVVVMSVTLLGSHATFSSYASRITNSLDTTGSRTFFTCKAAQTSLGASATFVDFALGTTSGTEADLSGNVRTGKYLAAVTTSGSVGCVRDSPASAVSFNGTNQCLVMNSATNTSQSTQNTFTVEAWFRTSSTSNGKIIGFGDSRTSAVDTNYDRQVYIDKDGRVVFGVYPGSVKVVSTPAGVNYADGVWHHVVATLAPAGQSLYVDGALAMTNPSVTTAQAYTGYWKVGCGNLTNWQNAATAATGSGTLDYSGPSYFTGQIQYAAVYTVALSAAQVKEHYLAGAA